MAMQTSQYANQVGGASAVDAILQQLDSVPHLIYGTLMLVLIAFVDQLSPTLSRYADTALGRCVAIAAIFGSLYSLGMVYGLLTATVLLLLIHSSPRTVDGPRTMDGFANPDDRSTIGGRWFVEKVLGERPERIIDGRVDTDAVQDDSETLMKHSGRSK